MLITLGLVDFRESSQAVVPPEPKLAKQGDRLKCRCLC